LKELKAASVYILAKTPALSASGSGFVVRSHDDTVFVATNHHVAAPTPDPDDGPGPSIVIPRMPFGPSFPRSPFGPRIPRMPGMPRRGVAMLLPPGPGAELTVVFSSGTEREQSLPATIVGDDADADLAILKVTGVRDAPRPIDYEHTPELVETMPVVALGFPFGSKLDPKKRNPAITVTKGAISSLRLDGGVLQELQLDLDLNPGNSGGPIVDEKGALVGVAVAKWGTSRIGFAVPVPKLKRLIRDRLDAR
jgi:S1-C subfamily serine protease